MPQINVIIDKLTNSIENAKTGENFKTQVLPLMQMIKVSPNQNGASIGQKNQPIFQHWFLN